MGSFADVFPNILNGVVKILHGVMKEIKTGPIGLGQYYLDSFTLMQYVGVFLFTNFFCGIKSLTNLSSCFIYYILDVFAQINYLPISILLFLISFIYSPIYQLETAFWDWMETVDKKVFGMTGFHFMHYPKSVRDKCYTCKRMKVSALVSKITLFIEDIESPIFNNLFSGIVDIIYGFMDFLQGAGDVLEGIMQIFSPMIDGMDEVINLIAQGVNAIMSVINALKSFFGG